MPWGNCTGPWWMGSRMNRAAGYVNPWCRGWGMRAGMGLRGRRGAFAAGSGPFRTPAPEAEMSYLEDVARDLEEDLKSVRERIEKLRSQS
ncbi:MAG TPA: DUF5320 domain-containing protein [Methanothrix sp.]|nr:DUF5320 domain-containing protein [Methanothrix sp.]